jgi:hypothetical protein
MNATILNKKNSLYKRCNIILIQLDECLYILFRNKVGSIIHFYQYKLLPNSFEKEKKRENCTYIFSKYPFAKTYIVI